VDGGVVPRKVTVVKLVQLVNALFSMIVTPLPMVTLVKLLQTPNAQLPMFVTLLGMMILVKPD
jgi:hypothetical protein